MPARDTDGVRLVRRTPATALTESGVTDGCRDEALTALVETCNNVVQHADPADQYEITVEFADQRRAGAVPPTSRHEPRFGSARLLAGSQRPTVPSHPQ